MVLCKMCLRVMLLIFNLVSVVSATTTCNTYDLETVYGAFQYMHTVSKFKYAIDPLSFDMVVGGIIERLDA